MALLFYILHQKTNNNKKKNQLSAILLCYFTLQLLEKVDVWA